MADTFNIDLTINMPDGSRHARQLLNHYVSDMTGDILETAYNLCDSSETTLARKFNKLTLKRAEVWSNPEHNLKIFVLLSVNGENSAFVKQVITDYMDSFTTYLKRASGGYSSQTDTLPEYSFQPTDWNVEVQKPEPGTPK